MQLKRLAKAPWVLSEAEDLEKSWLLLADIYCQGSKFDLALELLRRCVRYNKARNHTHGGCRVAERVLGIPGRCSRLCRQRSYGITSQVEAG